MKCLQLLCFLLAAAFQYAPTARAQAVAPAQPATGNGITANGVFGEVVSIGAGARQMALKTASGEVVTVVLDEKATVKGVPPGETTLGSAVDVSPGAIAVGDQVYARGRVAADRSSVTALQLIVMSRADIARKQEREREEWKRRSIAGVVSAADTAARELMLRMQQREGGGLVVVRAGAGTKFLRYEDGTVKFVDARPSSFEQIRVGDHVRVLGERGADGKSFASEVVVSGAFRTVLGSVKGVNRETGEILLLDALNGRQLTVAVVRDTSLLRLPPETAKALARAAQEANEGGQRANSPVELHAVLGHLPPLSLAELKEGDVIVTTAAAAAEAPRVTAIVLVSGAEPFLKVLRPGRSNLSGTGPAAGVNLGIVSP